VLCTLLDEAAAAVDLHHDARERGGHERIDVDGGAGERLDGERLARGDAVTGEDRETSDQWLAATVRHDDLAADAFFAACRDAGTEPAPGEGRVVGD
jgi:hypothetical protein